jgi:hypothetical protein
VAQDAAVAAARKHVGLQWLLLPHLECEFEAFRDHRKLATSGARRLSAGDEGLLHHV